MCCYKKARYRIVGDRGISVEFGNAVDEAVNLRVRKMLIALKQSNCPGIVEAFSTICSLFVFYDPLKVGLKKLTADLKKIESQMSDITLPPSNLYEIPCLYGGEHGPDLELVSKILGLSSMEIVNIHSGREYVLYDTGFMGGSAHFKAPDPLDQLLRKDTPNLGVPSGAVLIAGGLGSTFKTAPAPTGWYWIGTCPIQGWFPEKDPPLLLTPGNRIVYRPIEPEEFNQIKKMVEENRFSIKIITNGLEREGEG